MISGIGKPIVGICVAAFVFHAYEAATEWGGGRFAFALCVWSLIPYAVALAMAGVSGRPLVGIVSASFALLFDVRTFIDVHRSESSTAVLDYLWTPLWNSMIVVPLSAGVTWMWLRHNRHP